MKKAIVVISLIMIMFSLAFSVEAKKKTEGEGKIRFVTTSHDFGLINEKGGPVSVKFEFVNEGTGNLVIKTATAQCGCTRPTYPKKPIAPGKKGEIVVTYNPLGRPGSFTKTVTVRSTGKPDKYTLRITGRVNPGK